MNAAATSIRRVLVGYGSESGNAQRLAMRLAADQGLARHAPQLLAFDQIDVGSLGAGDVLLAISSSFGDGEPPANAARFHEALQQSPALPGLRYALFGLGDTGYPKFCGFTRELDRLLSARQARPIMNRVDADAGFEAFFARWAPVLGKVMDGDEAAAHGLHLQVSAYAQDNTFSAAVQQRRRLNTHGPGAWHLQLDLHGSGIAYRAGDTLHVIARNDPALLDALAGWYADPAAAVVLQQRELRRLGRPLLRELARRGGSEGLKQLLKTSQRPALEAYLHGADLLDVLQDHATPDSMPLSMLLEHLPTCLPRAYSIASHTREASVDLCVREVRYTHRGRERHGTATRELLQSGDAVEVYCRANPGFQLPADPSVPLLLVATGTGIAPLRGLMQQMEAGADRRCVQLLFGDRHREHDFLYRGELERWHAGQWMERLDSAFSRDSVQKYYVQHALHERADALARLFARGAHLYLCGNKAHLEQPMRELIDQVAADAGGWSGLQAANRLHCELY